MCTDSPTLICAGDRAGIAISKRASINKRVKRILRIRNHPLRQVLLAQTILTAQTCACAERTMSSGGRRRLARVSHVDYGPFSFALRSQFLLSRRRGKTALLGTPVAFYEKEVKSHLRPEVGCGGLSHQAFDVAGPLSCVA